MLIKYKCECFCFNSNFNSDWSTLWETLWRKCFAFSLGCSNWAVDRSGSGDQGKKTSIFKWNKTGVTLSLPCYLVWSDSEIVFKRYKKCTSLDQLFDWSKRWGLLDLSILHYLTVDFKWLTRIVLKTYWLLLFSFYSTLFPQFSLP